MTGFTIDFDASAALRVLRDLLRAAEDPRDALDAVGFELASRVDRTFEAQADPWNRAWRPLSPLTLRLRRKAGSGAEILRDTGRLANSITHNVDGNTLEVGTNVEYAKHHQHGRGPMYRPFLPLREDGSPELPSQWERGAIDVLERILRDRGASD